MELLTLHGWQRPASHCNEASEVKSSMPENLACLHSNEHQSSSFLDKTCRNKSTEALPLVEGNFLSKCFGVAIAICAVDSLRSACPGSQGSNSHFLSSALQSRSAQRGAMPLQTLMLSLLACQSEAKQDIAPFNHVEQSRILQKLECLQTELSELKRLRSEDGKANERVVSIFAGKEQEWKSERKKLREDLYKLYQQLQSSALLQQEAHCKKTEYLRSPENQPCSECEHKEGLLLALKERLGEQEFLIMATMEEVQIERQEKDVVAEKLAATELIVSELQAKLSTYAECHTLELTKREERLQQLERRINQAECENTEISQELVASQDRLTKLMHEKTSSQRLISDMSIDIEQLRVTGEGKDAIIAAMLKKANADAEVQKQLEKELAFMEASFKDAEGEKQKWGKLVPLYASSAGGNHKSRPRHILEDQPVPVAREMINDLQKLHANEIQSLQSLYEGQVQMLRKRLCLYQERVAELEDDILFNMAEVMRDDKNTNSGRGDISDNKCLLSFLECIKVELAILKFQLSIAKTLIKQFMESESHREQEIEKWKNLYFASRVTPGVKSQSEHSGAIVPMSQRLQNCLALEKSLVTFKLEQRHWQEIETLESQMRARDERMEAFRCQLLHMEDKVQGARRQVKTFKQSLEAAHDEIKRLEDILRQKDYELVACREGLSHIH